MRQLAVSVGWLFAALAAAYVAIRFLLPYVIPFVLALGLTAAIEPLVRWGTRTLRLPRGVLVVAALSAAVALLFVGASIALARLFVEVRDLYDALPAWYARSGDDLNRWLAEVQRYSAGLPDWARTALEENRSSVYRWLSALLGRALEGLQRIPQAVTVVAVTLLATFFMSRDWPEISRALWGLVPGHWRARLAGAQADMVLGSWGFFKAQLQLAALTALLMAAGLWLLGSPYALTLGLVGGLLDLIPMVGPTVVLGPWALYLILTRQGADAVGLLVLLAAVLGIRQAVEPRVISRQIGVHPLATLIAVYLGVQLFGMAGFIVGPLVAVMLKTLVRAGLLPGLGSAVPPDHRSGSPPGAGPDAPSGRRPPGGRGRPVGPGR